MDKCNRCFFALFDKTDHPCNSCDHNGSKYVKEDLYSAMDETMTFEMINNPSHYTQGKYEVIDVIEDWKLNFRLANVVKYVARADHKGKPVEDLRKAKWYLEREIAKRETESNI